jgi:leucyl-tRNA synthetase
MVHHVEDSIAQKPLDETTKQILMKVANTIRGLSMDAVQKALEGKAVKKIIVVPKRIVNVVT